jgi:hypothetical protein
MGLDLQHALVALGGEGPLAAGELLLLLLQLA